MVSLKIMDIPPSAQGAPDRFNDKMVRALRNENVEAEVFQVWPDLWFQILFKYRIPFLRRFLNTFAIPLWMKRHLNAFSHNDMVWVVNQPSLIPDLNCWFEKSIKKRKSKYIYWMEDNQLVHKPFEKSIRNRIQLADLILTSTPQLCDYIRRTTGYSNILPAEEPIDLERLDPIKCSGPVPIIAWTGRTQGLHRFSKVINVIKRVNEVKNCILRVVSGNKKPVLDLPFQWEWRPFSYENESENFKNVCTALSYLFDNDYDRCKGNYKVKTYMAMGIPPVVSNIGYNRQLVSHGKTGFLADSDDQMCQHLLYLINHPQQRNRMGIAARQRMVDLYSYSVTAHHWSKVLHEFQSLG